MSDSRNTEVYVYESVEEEEQPDPAPTSAFTTATQSTSKGEREGSIDTGHIALDESLSRFSSSSFDSHKKDFSDSLTNRHQRQRYQVLLKSNTVGPDTDSQFGSETPLQKYERLRAEVAQLLSQIEDVKSLKKDSAEEDEVDYIELAQSAQALSSQLAGADKDVKELLGLGSNAAPVLKPHLQSDLTQQLFSRIEAASKMKSSDSQSSSSSVVYELYYTPDTKEANIASRIADFDKRLSLLEAVLSGNNTALMENAKGLAGVVTDLKSKVDALDEKKIESLSSRIQKLTEYYTQLQSKATEATGLTPQQEKKVDELYQLVSKVELAASELPLVVDRLIQLKALHEESMAINSQWKALDAEQSEISALLTSNRDLLMKMEQNMATNLQTIQKNIQLLESRFADVAAKLQKTVL